MALDGPPTLRTLAELVHRADPAAAGPVVVTVASDSRGSLSLGLWSVPEGVGHPIDALIGVRAPASWSALGLVASGTLRSLEREGPPPTAVVSTVLVDRDGEAVSVIGPPDGPCQVIEDPPEGWAADALARALGRSTPPPAEPPSLWVEAAWLDRLALGLLTRPANRSWRWLADRHPLAGLGSTPTPADLARRTARHGAEHPWSALRAQAPAAVEVLLGTDPVHPPPPAEVVPVTEWFDDGAYARWLLRQLPPPEVLLPDLLAGLDRERGRQLLAALTAVSTALVVDGPP